MKKILITLILFILLWSQITSQESSDLSQQDKQKSKHPPSCGYNIIEAGRGVDCNNDTIPLVRNPPHGWRRATKADGVVFKLDTIKKK